MRRRSSTLLSVTRYAGVGVGKLRTVSGGKPEIMELQGQRSGCPLADPIGHAHCNSPPLFASPVWDAESVSWLPRLPVSLVQL